jgi:hypothetical protein
MERQFERFICAAATIGLLSSGVKHQLCNEAEAFKRLIRHISPVNGAPEQYSGSDSGSESELSSGAPGEDGVRFGHLERFILGASRPLGRGSAYGASRRRLRCRRPQERQDRMRPAIMQDVASRAGFSMGTVSNVLNRPEPVSDSTRQKARRRLTTPADRRSGGGHRNRQHRRAGSQHRRDSRRPLVRPRSDPRTHPVTQYLPHNVVPATL